MDTQSVWRQKCGRRQARRCTPGARLSWNPSLARSRKRVGSVASCCADWRKFAANGVWCAWAIICSNSGAMEGLRAWPKPPGDAPVALRWLFAERHVTAQLPLGEPRGWLKNKRPWESGHTVYKPYLAEPLVLILGRAPRAPGSVPITGTSPFSQPDMPQNKGFCASKKG